MNCKDCGLTMDGYGLEHHDQIPDSFPEHIDRCCDCADECLGMPAKNRTRPRPNPHPTSDAHAQPASPPHDEPHGAP